jgi:hypothetical protein
MTRQRTDSRSLATGSTLVITNLTKLAGVVLGLHEGLGTAPDGRVIGLAALFAAGAQVSETVLLHLIDRVLGLPEPAEDRKT